MTPSTIIETHASSEEINEVIDKIEESLAGTPVYHATIALIAATLIMMNPEISSEKLQYGVKEVSKYICLLIDEDEEVQGQVKKELMN